MNIIETIKNELKVPSEVAKEIKHFIDCWYDPDYSEASTRTIIRWARNAQTDIASGLYVN